MSSRFQVLDLPLDRIESAVALVPFFEKVRPLAGPAALLDWRLDGAMTRLLLAEAAHGALGEAVAIAGNHKIASNWALFVGGGQPPRGALEFEQLVGCMLKQAFSAGFRSVSIGFACEDSAERQKWSTIVSTVCRAMAPADSECLLTFTSPVHG